MGAPQDNPLIPELHERPTSVFLHGTSRPLLNWVLYAILTRTEADYHWTDVRFDQEVLDPRDPFALGVVSPNHMSIIEPKELARTRPPGPPPTGPATGENEPSVDPRLSEFLGLSRHTQETISRVQKSGRVPLLGLSNAHRAAGFYPVEFVQPTLKAILGSGVSMIMTWADAVPGGSAAFDFVLGVEGSDPATWRDAQLRCNLGYSRGPLRAGRVYRLGDVASVAEVLGRFNIPGL